MQQGKLDAFFAVGGVPIDGVGDLLASHVRQAGAHHRAGARSAGQGRAIADGSTITYPGQDAVATVATRATLWIVRDSVPDNLVYGITRALFNPANRDALRRQPSFRARDRPCHRRPDAARAASSGRRAFLCRSRRAAQR